MGTETFQRHVTINGRVALNEGNGIKISTERDAYVVELDYIGKELLEFLNKNIKATGFVTRYNGGTTQIAIDDYEICDEKDSV